jgi:hypothetical protein
MTDEPPPLNREQRRAQKFRRRSTARQDNLHTHRENATGFLTSPADSLADGPRGAPVDDASATGPTVKDAAAAEAAEVAERSDPPGGEA